MEKINVRGVSFDNVNMKEAVEICRNFLKTDRANIIHTPNSEIVQLCIENKDIRTLINSADLIIPDGAGVVKAAKILGTPLMKGKVAGCDLCEELCRISGQENAPIFFLGGKPGIPEAAAEKLKEKYPDMIVAGTNDGYFKNDKEIVEKINQSGAKILFVCLGVPKQEQWMNKYRSNFTTVRIAGGFGGTLDVLSGASNRAPDFFINNNLEWFYRLCKEPKRAGRMMKLPKFMCGAVKDKITNKKYDN